MNERRLRDMLGSARSHGELGDLIEDLMKTTELKTPELILAEAEVSGKDGQIRHLGEAIEAFYSRVADLKKKLEERDAKVNQLTAELEGTKRVAQAQGYELGIAKMRIIDLETALQIRDQKLSVIGKILTPMSYKTPKVGLWKAIKEAQTVL